MGPARMGPARMGPMNIGRMGPRNIGCDRAPSAGPRYCYGGWRQKARAAAYMICIHARGLGTMRPCHRKVT